jgi:nitrogen fixation protein NifU and related proteins
MYSAILLDHFEHPRNSGALPEANIRVRVENPVCADVLELALRVHEGVVEEVRFKAKGCVPSVACASVLTELLQGAPIEAIEVTAAEIERRVGGLPQASSHAAQLAIDATVGARREALRLQKSAAQRG